MGLNSQCTNAREIFGLAESLDLTTIKCYVISPFSCISPMGKLFSSSVVNNNNIATSLDAPGFINVHREVAYKLLSHCFRKNFSHICDSFLDLLPNF